MIGCKNFILCGREDIIRACDMIRTEDALDVSGIGEEEQRELPQRMSCPANGDMARPDNAQTSGKAILGQGRAHLNLR